MVLRSSTSHQPRGNIFQHSRSYRLRSRRKRSSNDQPTVDSFEQATRLLRMFHAHEARSLDSIVEHPEDNDDINYDTPNFFPLSRQLTKVKTMSCLSDLEEHSQKGDLVIRSNRDVTNSNTPRIQGRPSMSVSEYSERHDEDSDDDWEF